MPAVGAGVWDAGEGCMTAVGTGVGLTPVLSKTPTISEDSYMSVLAQPPSEKPARKTEPSARTAAPLTPSWYAVPACVRCKKQRTVVKRKEHSGNIQQPAVHKMSTFWGMMRHNILSASLLSPLDCGFAS